MTKTEFLEYIYNELIDIGLVSSSAEYSRLWLGHEGSYLGVLKAKNKQPPVGTLVTCALKLKTMSSILNEDSKARVEKLFAECIEEVFGSGFELVRK